MPNFQQTPTAPTLYSTSTFRPPPSSFLTFTPLIIPFCTATLPNFLSSMAATGACVFHGALFSPLRPPRTSSLGSFKSTIPNPPRLAVSTTSMDHVASSSLLETTSTSSVSDLFGNARFDKTYKHATTAIVGVGSDSGTRFYSGSQDTEVRRSLKDYFEQSVELIRSDTGPPRWFSPLESGSRMDNSPLLLFLPGWFSSPVWIGCYFGIFIGFFSRPVHDFSAKITNFFLIYSVYR